MKMETSDYIAFAALIISLIGIPLSAWLSYQSAKRAFIFQESEKAVCEVINAKERIVQEIELFGRLMKTVAEEEFSINFASPDFQNKFNAVREQIYSKVAEYGSIENIYAEIRILEKHGFNSLLENKDQNKQESYTAFSLHMQNPTIKRTDKVYSCYRTFFEHGVLDFLKALEESEIRSFLSQ